MSSLPATFTPITVQPLSKTDRLDDMYVVAGDRAYLIGSQDGAFPAIGHHIRGEMAGLWAHPHKLLNGFWCAVGEPAPDAPPPARGHARITGDHSPRWLPAATRFESYPWGVVQTFDLPAQGVRLSRSMLVPDGRPALLVDLTLTDLSGRAREVELTVLCQSNLRPGWLDERPDADDQAVVSDDGTAVEASDPTGPWFVAWGAADTPVDTTIGRALPGPRRARGRGIGGRQRYRLAMPAGGETTLRFGVHGSTLDAASATGALRDLVTGGDELIEAKKARLAAVLAYSRLDVPDEALARSWSWTRCAYDWLVRDVPGVGRGLGAGLPEYPWWFSCDTSYALRGLLPLGGFELAAQSLRLLAAASERANAGTGRIIHELSCTDRVFNPGNTQETPQFACAVLETYLWSGDHALLADLYDMCRRGVLSWTLERCDADGDLLPEGYGITEVAGLNVEVVDTAVWTYTALRALGRMATIVGDGATAARCATLAPRLREAIERRFWLEDEGLYADLIAAPRVAVSRFTRMRERALAWQQRRPDAGTARLRDHLERLVKQAGTAPRDEETAWYLGNWVINAPLEMGLSSWDRAERVLARLETPEFYGPTGAYLDGVSRWVAMSISTGALAAAECAYGRVDKAIDITKLLAGMATLRMPGAISEMSPAAGCFVQAWSGYGAVYPLACGVFGLYPDAAARHLVLCPYLPAGWDYARLRDVRLGDAHLDIALERQSANDAAQCVLRIDRPGWRVTLLPQAVSPAGSRPPLTAINVHAAAGGEQWGLDAAIRAAGDTVELTAGRTLQRPIE